ncbi:fimbria/pilus outer membrane usher protein [Dyella mobilis]|uniref:Fimbria/pilus outer membrane usher protein n=1 Tax=Dyella mobilis TaxID=1849582 RepID=A0ABS2KMM2_9GAMM|nr:fimbria/pilus outer membrane usher protein [Dyella mobilis]
MAPASPASPASPVAPAEAEFETNFLSTGTDVDLSRFAKGNVVLPGTYRADVSINQTWIGREDIVFKLIDGQTSAAPCFDRESLRRFGVDLDKVARGDGKRSPEEVAAHTIPEGELCGDLGKYIPGASIAFNEQTQSLAISVPQLYMNNSARGYVDPSQWDSGINAGTLGYNFSASRSTGAYHGSQAYLGLNAGFNLGDWHLRHQGSLNWSSSGRKNYTNIASYVQRDIPSIKSQLVVGDTFTSGQIADSFRVRGVSLFSDPTMYPQSQQGYAPTVRGVAETNARVTIRQRGYVLYETTVAPGPFEINDLFPTGYGGDLEVTVTETDGRQNTFLVPYAAVPQLLRPGITQYSATAGQLQQTGTGNNKPWVAQATWQHGFNNTFTGYAAGTASTGYTQALVGTAINTPVGAVAVNLAASVTQFPEGQRTRNGQSLGVTYSKNVIGSGTNFSLAAYRFSSSGYYGLLDAVNARDYVRYGQGLGTQTRQRSRLDLTVNQKVGNGQLFFSGSTSDYWGGAGRTTSYSAGYSNTFKSVTWSLSAQRTRTQAYNPYQSPLESQQDQADDVFYGPGRIPGPGVNIPGRTDNRIMLNISVPLGSSSNAPSLYTYLSRDNGSNSNKGVQVGVNGSAGENRAITYGVSANRNISQGGGSSYFNTSLGYQGAAGSVQGGYSRSGNTNQISASASGGVVVHSGGVLLTPQLGSTIGIVEAPGAKGALVTNATNVRINNSGYAAVPYLTPYQSNTVGINPQGMSENVELKDTTKTVAPRLGAVVKLKYQTDEGRSVIIKARRKDGQPLPFAADVLNEKGDSVGSVGQGSKIFVRGVTDNGTLQVKWGDTAAEQCYVQYQLPPQEKGSTNATVLPGVCVASPNAPTPADSKPTNFEPVTITPLTETPSQPVKPTASRNTINEAAWWNLDTVAPTAASKPTTTAPVAHAPAKPAATRNTIKESAWWQLDGMQRSASAQAARNYSGIYGSVASTGV